jgi:two-component system, OmpR family, KDP operon response regulator KdpE
MAYTQAMRTPDAPPTGRVLVVEDDPRVRALIAETLRHDGHIVAEADSLAGAQQVAGTAAVDLVLTDLRLPDAPGTEAVAAVRAAHPAAAALLMSGFTDPIPEDGSVGYLAKPFGAAELRDRVRALLAG